MASSKRHKSYVMRPRFSAKHLHHYNCGICRPCWNSAQTKTLRWSSLCRWILSDRLCMLWRGWVRLPRMIEPTSPSNRQITQLSSTKPTGQSTMKNRLPTCTARERGIITYKGKDNQGSQGNPDEAAEKGR